MIIKTKSAAQTRQFGKVFAKKIAKGGIVCLYGDLGAGKTTLVQGIANGLAIKKRPTSPTFIIMRQYNNLHHLDLYRLDSLEEIKSLGIEEIWSEPTNILLIEWPEKIAALLPKKRWEVRLKALGESAREISYEAIH